MTAPLATGISSELVVATFGRDAGNGNDRWSELVVAAFGRAADNRIIFRIGGSGIWPRRWQQAYFQNWWQRHLAAPPTRADRQNGWWWHVAAPLTAAMAYIDISDNCIWAYYWHEQECSYGIDFGYGRYGVVTITSEQHTKIGNWYNEYQYDSINTSMRNISRTVSI